MRQTSKSKGRKGKEGAGADMAVPSKEPRDGTGGEPEELSMVQVLRIAQEAEGFLELGIHHRALERAERLLRSRAGRQAGLSLKAECFRRADRFEEAIPVLEEALREWPDDEGLWVNMGWCRKRTGRLDLAIQAMEDLLARQPESPIGHYNLACYLSLAGEKERALGELRMAFELEPGFKDLAKEESDFDPLRGDPEFEELLD